MARRRCIEVSIAHDEQFNALSEWEQLLYLRILPHTDDSGRMSAIPAVVKARCFPTSDRALDDFSTAISSMIAAGLLLVQKAGNTYVLQFKPEAFERINRVMIHNSTVKSEYAEAEGRPLTPHEYVQVCKTTQKQVRLSAPERKAREKKAPRVDLSAVAASSKLLAIPGFKEMLTDWIEQRSQSRKPLTAHALTRQLKFLERQADPVAVIEQSIRNQWQGLFELKSKGDATTTETVMKRWTKKGN